MADRQTVERQTAEQMGEPATRSTTGRSRKALTIGAVAKILSKEFNDVSISKIRYLEDQKLLTPRRTTGGYRLYSQGDVDRLRTILRLQRDEFLPLRVIRQELASGPPVSGLGTGAVSKKASNMRRASLIGAGSSNFSLEEVVEETGARSEFVRELADFGLIQADKSKGSESFDETDMEVVRAANELSHFGVAARNLRVFRTSADREANLLEALLAPSLGSRNPQRRKEAVESLERLATTVADLKNLLLVRDLRRLADR